MLIGQPELATKLSERNMEVREVVQRCEVVELLPLDNNLEEFLTFKLQRAGKQLTDIMDAGAVDAIRARLSNPEVTVKIWSACCIRWPSVTW